MTSQLRAGEEQRARSPRPATGRPRRRRPRRSRARHVRPAADVPLRLRRAGDRPPAPARRRTPRPARQPPTAGLRRSRVGTRSRRTPATRPPRQPRGRRPPRGRAPSVEFTVQAVLVRSGGYHHADVAPDACRAPSHLCATPLTAADPRCSTWPPSCAASPATTSEFAQRCSARVHELITYEYGVTTTATTAAQALALGRGVCQDHAHVMIAICRAAGVPARYVSGHLLGEGGTHAWVEVLVADAGTVALELLPSTRATAAEQGCGTSRSRSAVTMPTSPRRPGASPASPRAR